jgi:hypothetical protein
VRAIPQSPWSRSWPSRWASGLELYWIIELRPLSGIVCEGPKPARPPRNRDLSRPAS